MTALASRLRDREVEFSAFGSGRDWGRACGAASTCWMDDCRVLRGRLIRFLIRGILFRAEIFLGAAGAVVGRLADGDFGSEHVIAEGNSLGEVERIALEVVNGAHTICGNRLFHAGCDTGGDLQSVEHEAATLEFHGLVVESAHDLPDGEEHRGEVFKRWDHRAVFVVHVVELHVEVAIGLAIEGAGAAALSVILDVAALFEFDFSLRSGIAAGYPSPLGAFAAGVDCKRLKISQLESKTKGSK